MVDPWRDEPEQQQESARQREEPEAVPAISSEQPSVAAGIGVGAYVGRTEEDDAADNDQESHVSPADNDGETVPQDEVADQVGG